MCYNKRKPGGLRSKNYCVILARMMHVVAIADVMQFLKVLHFLFADWKTSGAACDGEMIFGENRLTELMLEKAIAFYEAEGQGMYQASDYKKEIRTKYPERDFELWNIARQRKLMRKKRTEWEACHELS